MAVYIETEKIYRAYLNGARYVINGRQELNSINVFPVADGDTGNNLAAAMKAIIENSRFNLSVKDTFESVADACLKGARGNSGIIFAQYMSGVSEEIENEERVTIDNFANAHMKSVEYAYGAVNKPVEGTMLTVMKDWAVSMFDFKGKAKDFTDLLAHSYKKLEESLKNTKNQLAELRRAGVVDSGAKGFSLFVKGILDFLKSDRETEIRNIMEEVIEGTGRDSHDNPKFRYCVEVLLADGLQFRDKLNESLKVLGDSLVVAGNKRMTRVHIHTDSPAAVFTIAENHSAIIEKKVDDMKKQAELESNKKFRIGLVTDSIADLPQEIIDEYQIHIVNLSILIGEKEYYDKLTIENKTLIKYYREGSEFPTSSQPSVALVQRALDNIKDKYESIIVITVASVLSGTNSVFAKEAEILSADGYNISVIDSKQNSGSEGLLVYRAAKMIEQGIPHEEIVAKIKSLTRLAKILVSVKNLETMIKGGRLGSASGKVAERLNLKPIVTLNSEGKGTIGGIAFSIDGTRKKLIADFKRTNNKYGIEDYCIIHVQNNERAVEFARILEELSGKKPLYILEASSVIAISAGDGALALAYIRKDK
ncbi:MAG: DegV family EDD domain-containing protein [Clostridia bacterium]|nr:DegV family EDD domain-containing protein [Clostridia bacterium]MBN2882732.1 DegV family EDD domain-containing protein [Clostridia bacterium]